MKRSNLSPAEKEQIFDLRELGWSLARIARKVGCSEGSVSWHCLQAGIDKPGAKPIDKTIRGPLVVKRGAFNIRRFTPEEDQQIVALRIQGLTLAEIGRIIGRRHNSIVGRLATLARHDERRAA